MASYVAHYTKKQQILGRKELALRRLIDRGAAPEKLMSAAADVRDARIRALRARRATIVPKNDAYVQYAKIDDKIQALLNTPLLSILADFGLEWQNADTQSSD